MAKLTLSDISSGYLSGTTYTANNTAIETAVENTLSRDGTAPNQMGAALDMNSYAINNLPNAVANQSPVTLAQAAALVDITAATQASVGALLWPRTAAEISAGVTPTNYYYEPGNVLRYGATGDGVTDDTTAIQNALLANGGSDVVFPAATYIVDGSLLTVQSGTTIYGYGATLKLDAATYASTRYFLGTNTGISWDAGYATATDISIMGITIDGNISNVTLTGNIGCYGINIYKTTGCIVRDVTIKDLPGTLGYGYGLVFSFSSDCRADYVNVNRTDRQNIIIWESLNTKITGCTLKDSYFRECILVSGNSPATVQDTECIISDCDLENTLSTGTNVVRFSGESTGQISNSRIYGYKNGAAGHNGISIPGPYPKNVVITNVIIDNCYRGVDASTDSADNIVINNSHIGVNTSCYDGVRINKNTASFKMSNTSVNVTNQPLYVNAADYQSITGNEFIGGADNLAIFSEAAGTTVFANNTIRDNTDASYAVFLAGAGEPVVVGNKTIGNTQNIIRCTTGAVVSGNSATTTIDGAAKSGTIVKRSTTGNRPTLTASDIGVLYLDTTLATIGQPVFWTGTAWVACATSDGTTGGTASAGAGNQYVELEINGNTYKLLHDGTA